MRVFVLTGAGISAESGLATFRDSGGLWEGHDVMAVATPEGFARDPALVHRFYDLRRRDAAAAGPNAAHRSLVDLDAVARGRGGSLFLCTQNVDDLHERAGSPHVHHLHGTLGHARCTACGTVSPWPGDMGVDARCPACGAAALRPDIVWFGEVPMGMDVVQAALAEADLFVSVGTSGSVYPAAGFVETARNRGAITVEINREPSSNDDLFDHAFRKPATVAVPEFLRDVFDWPPGDPVKAP